MMDAAYFVGRRAILEWINTTFQMNLAKIEETASGACMPRLRGELSSRRLLSQTSNGTERWTAVLAPIAYDRAASLVRCPLQALSHARSSTPSTPARST